MKILIIINDAPYGTEKAYNALRLANQIGKDHPQAHVTIFLMADAVGCAIAGQQTPNGYYNIERMLRLARTQGAQIKLCTSCSDARGIRNTTLIDGAEMSSMAELANLTIDSDKVITF
jgi:uncharacterized protein involved in oxidation of intracellular sulfur